MSTPNPSPQRFMIVPKKTAWRGWLIVIAIVWLLSLLGTWYLASSQAAPGLASADRTLGNQSRQLEENEALLKQVQQQLATLRRSEQISRNANTELQSTLSDRDEEIEGLRADVAFYERLVGATAQRRGLNVHDIQFEPEVGGTWHFKATVTQNLNRGAISQGNMKFSVEGISLGRLKTVPWENLVQRSDMGGKPYSFRYFQELDGSVLLPSGFTPQRVKVSLRGNNGQVDQVFPWNAKKVQENK
ncbi:MAG TPA: hypothetical protein PLF92_12245 [Arenimonas sp.]|mgnify:CR=1 FL=1|nr:hypothetical protein [Arenimonas sp.]